MKRLLSLFALAAAGAAMIAQHLQVQAARDETENLRADLMWAQDHQYDLISERDHWREIAEAQLQTITALSGSPAGAPLGTLGDGSGLWLFKDGWIAPRGPFTEREEAQEEGEATARQYPGETIHVLGSLNTVMVAPAEPHWENE